jgi:hypothetical protein
MIQTAKRDSNEPRAGLSFLDKISKPTPQNLEPKDARFNVVKSERLSKIGEFADTAPATISNTRL